MRKLSNEELNRIGLNEYKNSNKAPIVIVLDNLRSLNNIGSVFRTSDAFRIDKIHLCGITGTPPHREINKTALGSTESVAWEYFTETLDSIEKLRSEGFKICTLEQADESLSLEQFRPEGKTKYAFVFGNEIKGVSDEVVKQADYCIEIPQFGTKHSFNSSGEYSFVRNTVHNTATRKTAPPM